MSSICEMSAYARFVLTSDVATLVCDRKAGLTRVKYEVHDVLRA